MYIHVGDALAAERRRDRLRLEGPLDHGPSLRWEAWRPNLLNDWTF